MILLQKNRIIRVLMFWIQSKEETYRLGCLIKIEIKENFIVACKHKRFKHRLFPLSLTKCYFVTQEICWAQKEDNHEIWLSCRCIFKIQAGTGSSLSWLQHPDENIIFSNIKNPPGGGHSHTLPIRVCAAQRGRDFEAPDLERGIHFRGVF